MRRGLALSGPLAVAFALALFPSSLRASVAKITLKELVDGSDLIVLATVTKVENGPALNPEDRGMPGVKVATARAIETWKGHAPRDVRYMASRSWACDTSRAEVGERVVLFLTKPEGSPLMMIAHAGRGRMPLRDVKGRPYATIWVDDDRLPTGVLTIPGPEPEYSFIRSVDLRALRLIVHVMSRTNALIMGSVVSLALAGLTWYISSLCRPLRRASVPPEEVRGDDRSITRDARFENGLRAVAKVEFAAALVLAFVVLWCHS